VKKTLNDHERDIVILWLIQEIRAGAGGCNSAVLQKCAVFLQELLGVPLDMNVILHVYAPYSFDLKEDVGGMLSQRMLVSRYREPYGAELVPSEHAPQFEAIYARTVAKYRPAIRFVAERLGNKPYLELERLSMALYVSLRRPEASREDLAGEIVRLVPRISFLDALEALEAVNRMRSEMEALNHHEPAPAATADRG
jgi:hypothetical protein